MSSLCFHTRLYAGMAAAMLFFSCSRPSSEEFFQRTGTDGRYSFTLALDDSLYRYDVSLLVVLACGDADFTSFDGFPLGAKWTSPSGTDYLENLWVTNASLVGRRHYSKRFYLPYRGDLEPKEYGLWGLELSLPTDFVREYSVSGLGLRLERHKDI